jgi:hypothetical protein
MTDTMACPGSGGYPAERVILDTVPGANPTGTCPSCRRCLTLDFYRIPHHVHNGPLGDA